MKKISKFRNQTRPLRQAFDLQSLIINQERPTGLAMQKQEETS